MAERRMGRAVRASHFQRRGPLVLASAASVSIHAALLIFLLSQPRTGILGNSGISSGPGGKSDGSAPAFADLVPASVKGEANSATLPADGSPEDATSSIDETVPQEQDHAADIDGQTGVTGADQPKSQPAAGENGLADQAADGEGGSPGLPDGQLALLVQIARCLPPGIRPDLRPGTLSISVDPQGALSAVPALNIDVSRLTKDQLRDANYVVQAALQCGPYGLTQDLALTVDLVPDFSAVPVATP